MSSIDPSSWPRALATITLASLAPAVTAQNLNPSGLQPKPKQMFSSEITVTATGVATETEDVPTPTTIIDREEMDDAQAENVADVLRRVPGLTVLRSGDEGKQTSIFTRGTNSNQTLVLYDGVRLNSPYLGGYDLSLLPTSGLERIEVARGPYSALRGADAVGGVVNVIPQRGRNRTAASFFGEGGDNGWQRYEGDVVLGGKHLGLYVSGLYREGDGELDNSDFSSEQVFADVGWSWGSRGSRLAVIYQDAEVETGIPFVTPGVPTLERRQSSEQQLLAVPFRWSASDEWTVELIAAEVERGFTFHDPEDPFGLTDTVTEANTSQARLASHHTLGGHILSWGGEWREDEVTAETNFGTNLDNNTSEVTSAFLQDVWRFGDALRLIGGVRWDDTEEWGDEVSPRLHLGWMMTGDVELRVGFGKAFRQPSLGELFFPFFGNPELEPETSTSYELGIAWAPADRDARWELNLFATDLENLIQYDFIESTNRNIGTAEIRGAELVVESAVTNASHQLLQVTWLDTSDDIGDRLLRRPEWSASYSLGGLIWYNVRGDITVLWVGSRDDVDPVTFERVRVTDHYAVHLALGWQAWDSLELTLRMINLTDQSYQEVLGYPAPGRRFMGGLRIRL
jgi:outer membrane cobalamin receptor